jgi:hypothetical protein
LTAFKNTFAFAVSFAVIPWIEKDGFTKVGQSKQGLHSLISVADDMFLRLVDITCSSKV